MRVLRSIDWITKDSGFFLVANVGYMVITLQADISAIVELHLSVSIKTNESRAAQ